MNTIACRYCGLPVVQAESKSGHTYWSGIPFVAHRKCYEAGFKAEVLECQTIDADCNDCRHFKRGKLLPKVISNLKKKNGSIVDVIHQPNVFDGECLKFDRATVAQPNKWSGLECFEHRRV